MNVITFCPHVDSSHSGPESVLRTVEGAGHKRVVTFHRQCIPCSVAYASNADGTTFEIIGALNFHECNHAKKSNNPHCHHCICALRDALISQGREAHMSGNFRAAKRLESLIQRLLKMRVLFYEQTRHRGAA
jgi:hypothetical protein